MTSWESNHLVTVGQFPDPFRGGDVREWVGGDAGSGLPFRESCRFQLDFLIAEGLTPESTLLDLGCGCLRGGVHFIEYLSRGRYLGLDISETVVRWGINHELGTPECNAKWPEFVVSDAFDFGAFSKTPDVVFANSLFTHLPADSVTDSLAKLRRWCGPSCEAYATFSLVDADSDHGGKGHYCGGRAAMTYTRDEVATIARQAGWRAEHIGVWGHPKNLIAGDVRQQSMFRFTIPGADE